jgi:hypothetical protein
MSALLNIAKQAREDTALAKKWKPYVDTFLAIVEKETQALYVTRVQKHVDECRAAGVPMSLAKLQEEARTLVFQHGLVPQMTEKTEAVYAAKTRIVRKPMARAMKVEDINSLNEKRRLLGEKDFYLMCKEYQMPVDFYGKAIESYFQQGVCSIEDIMANVDKVKPDFMRDGVYRKMLNTMLLQDIFETPLWAMVVQRITSPEGKGMNEIHTLTRRMGQGIVKPYDPMMYGRWFWKLVNDNRVQAMWRDNAPGYNVNYCLEHINYKTFDEFVHIVNIFRLWKQDEVYISKHLSMNEHIEEDIAKKLKLLVN